MYHFESDATGYWPTTSTLDWCESNYTHCKYIAEFWNSATNLSYVLCALYGAYMVHRYRMEKRFLAAYISLGVIGIGSFLFHATLMYEMQLMDELPMLFTVCVLTYIIFEARPNSKHDRALGIFLTLDAVLVTIIYLWWKQPIFFQAAYAIHIALIFLRGLSLYLELKKSPEKHILQRLFSYGWGMHAAAIVLWNIDNHFCGDLRVARQGLGDNFSWLLQLHGWWHVLTGIGSYAHILGNQWLRLMMLDQSHEFKVHWLGGIFPILRPADDKTIYRKEETKRKKRRHRIHH